MKSYFAESELIINTDGSVFHLHVKPDQLADKVILVGDPGRVPLVASHFDSKECEIESREFRTVTGSYCGKRITVTSTGIGCDNIDIVLNELDALANIDFDTRKKPRQAARNCENRHLRRLATVYSRRNIHLFGDFHRIRRPTQFLCRAQCCMRPATRTRIDSPSWVDRQHVCTISLCHRCRQRTCGAHSRQRHGERNNHFMRRVLRPTRP